MKKIITMVCLVCVASLTTQAALIAYWNFNGASYTTPSNGTGTLNVSGASGAGQSSANGTTQNALKGDGGSKTLLISGPNGQSIIFSMSMSGLQNLQLSYATVKSTTGFDSQAWSFSTDNSTFTPFTTISGDSSIPPYSSGPISDDYAVDTVSFSSISALNNDPTIWIKLTLSNGSGGSDRFDNIQFNASPVPEPAAWGVISGLGLLGICGLRTWRERKPKTEMLKAES